MHRPIQNHIYNYNHIYNNNFKKLPKALAPGGSMEEEGCDIVREEP